MEVEKLAIILPQENDPGTPKTAMQTPYDRDTNSKFTEQREERSALVREPWREDNPARWKHMLAAAKGTLCLGPAGSRGHQVQYLALPFRRSRSVRKTAWL